MSRRTVYRTAVLSSVSQGRCWWAPCVLYEGDTYGTRLPREFPTWHEAAAYADEVAA